MDADNVGLPRSFGLHPEAAIHSTFREIRERIAPGFGCDPDEIVITHNTTDALCKVLAGLDFREGDEILTTNHEHFSSLAPMAVLRDRYGIVIRRVRLPTRSAQRAEEYLELFASAITARTRLMLFSAPTYTTGTLLPIRMLTKLAQRWGITTLLDGAHFPGMLSYPFRELGVDFLAGSGSKWQGGPPGTGILYLRNKVHPAFNSRPVPTLWPVVSVWYPFDKGSSSRSAVPNGRFATAEYLQTTGSASLSRMEALCRACELWDRVGRKRIESHVLALSRYLKDRVVAQWGEAALFSPKDDPRLMTAMTAFSPFTDPSERYDDARLSQLVERLANEHRIHVCHTSFKERETSSTLHALRVSTRVCHGRDDVDRFLRAVTRLSSQ